MFFIILFNILYLIIYFFFHFYSYFYFSFSSLCIYTDVGIINIIINNTNDTNDAYNAFFFLLLYDIIININGKNVIINVHTSIVINDIKGKNIYGDTMNDINNNAINFNTSSNFI